MNENEIKQLAGSLMPLLPGAPDGPAVQAWRRILNTHASAMKYGRTVLPKKGSFDSEVERWTRQFQSDAYLARVDGVVGPVTWGAALQRYPDQAASVAVQPAASSATPATSGPEQTRQRLTPAEKTKRFGEPRDEKRLTKVLVPELVGIPGAPDSGIVLFNKAAETLLRDLFVAWRAEGLLPWVLSFNGAYQPRRRRPKAGAPPEPSEERPWSDHALGTAFDINADWNLVGYPPAAMGERGSVLRLVETAQRCGFWWGGFDPERPDGSHFEVGGALIAKPVAATAETTEQSAKPRSPSRGEGAKAPPKTAEQEKPSGSTRKRGPKGKAGKR